MSVKLTPDRPFFQIFQIFVTSYHDNIGIGLKQILIAQLNNTLKTPCLVQESRTYLLYEPSYSQFCVEITTISYHGNKGRSG